MALSCEKGVMVTARIGEDARLVGRLLMGVAATDELVEEMELELKRRRKLPPIVLRSSETIRWRFATLKA